MRLRSGGGEFVMAFLAENDEAARAYGERWLDMAHVAPRSSIKIQRRDGSAFVITKSP